MAEDYSTIIDNSMTKLDGVDLPEKADDGSITEFDGSITASGKRLNSAFRPAGARLWLAEG